MATADAFRMTALLEDYPARLAAAGRFDRLLEVLTLPKFLRNKVAAGLVRELQADYENAFRALATPGPLVTAASPRSVGCWKAGLEPWAEFIRANAAVFQRHPELFFQQALNEPDDSPVAARVRDYREASGQASPWLERMHRGACRRERHRVARGLPGIARTLAVTSDGSIVVAGTDTGEVLAWRPGSEVWRAVGSHGDGVAGVVVLGAGRAGYSVSDDETLRAWDFAAGGPTAQVVLGHRPRSLCTTGDHGPLVVGGEDGSLDLRAGPRLRSKRRWPAHDGQVIGLAGGRDGRTVASLGWDNALRVWDLARGGKLAAAHLSLPMPSAVAAPDAFDRVLLGCTDGRVGWLDLGSGRFDTHAAHGAPVTSVWCDGPGRATWSASDDGNLVEWRSGTTRVRRAQTFGVTAIAVAEQTGQIVSAGYDRSVQFWPGAADGEGVGDLPWRDSGWVVAFTGDGTRAVTWGVGGAVVTWPVGAGRWAVNREVPGLSQVKAAAIDGDGRLGVTGSQTGEVCLWDLERWRPTLLSPPHRGAVTAVAVTPDGRFAATWARDGRLSTWDLRTGTHIRPLRGCGFLVMAAGVTPTFSKAAAWSTDNQSVRVWDLRGGALTAHTSRGSPQARGLAESSGLGELYAARADGEGVVVAGLFGGDTLARAVGPFVAGASTPDGRGVAACDPEGVVTFFRLST